MYVCICKHARVYSVDEAEVYYFNWAACYIEVLVKWCWCLKVHVQKHKIQCLSTGNGEQPWKYDAQLWRDVDYKLRGVSQKWFQKEKF